MCRRFFNDENFDIEVSCFDHEGEKHLSEIRDRRGQLTKGKGMGMVVDQRRRRFR